MIKVGTVVELKVACLGNSAGTEGVVYDTYNIGDGPGASVIFPNGEYDGFSPEEQKSFLNVTRFASSVADYQFINVMRLSEDFNAGKFNQAFAL